MLTRTRNGWLNMWRRIFKPSISGLPQLSTDEQTRLSWAKTIESYAAVPSTYKDFFAPYLAAGRAFPYTVLAPSYEGFIHRTTEKLICDCGDEIYVLEKSRNSIATHGYPLEGIRYVEERTILLDSSLKISGVTGDGHSAFTNIKFNTVTEYLFTPFVERFRLASAGVKGAAQQSELVKFVHLLKVNYKFMNYARRSLLGDEKVLHTILQPEIRTPLVKFLSKTFYKAVSPTHMIILTDREVILIREEARQSGDDRYGGIWTYLPVKKIVKLSLNQRDSGLLALSIQLPENEQLEYLFQASTQAELDQLILRFGELANQ